MIEFTDRKAAFEIRALPHIDALFRTASWMINDEQYAENLVRQTFSKAYHLWDKFCTAPNCQSFLFEIMISIFARDFKVRQKSPALINSADDDDYYFWKQPANLGSNLNQIEVLFPKISSADVRRILTALPDDFKLVVVLSWLEGFSYGDIGYIVGINLEVVKSRLYQGCHLIRNGLYECATGERQFSAVI